MARKHELQIEITADGQVQVKTVGAKGKQCLEYVRIFNTMGEVKDQQLTGEYYEPDSDVGIVEDIRNSIT
jgi:hypothetical protein